MVDDESKTARAICASLEEVAKEFSGIRAGVEAIAIAMGGGGDDVPVSCLLSSIDDSIDQIANKGLTAFVLRD